jgi:putative ABC transport system permease protein
MMRTIHEVVSRLLSVFRKTKLDREFDEELSAHIDLLTERNRQRGLPADEARRQAVLRMGGVSTTQELHREARGLPVLESFGQDLRYACRSFRRSRGFAAIAILSLAIGIAANTAIFSLVDAVLLRPLAYHEPGRLFSVGELTLNGQAANLVNPMHAREWAKECPSLEQITLVRINSSQVAARGEPATVRAADVSYNFFALFGVEPILGRAFLEEEEHAGSDRVVVLSESLWRSRFGGNPSIVGTSILVDGRNRQVIGIVPKSFRLPRATNTRVEVFRPLVLRPDEIGRLGGNYNYQAFIRVKRGIAAERALAEIEVVQARFPRPGVENVVLKAALTPVHELVTSGARLGLWMLAAAVGAVLFIVCINLANLFLSRIASRRREAAIRTALGASRGRQFRQVMTESLLLSVCGGLLGSLFGRWIVQLLVATTTLDIPRLDEAYLDSGVLMFAVGLTLLTGFVVGALPALQITRQVPQEALRAGSHIVTEGKRGMRLRELLISLEVGMSTALLIVASLLWTSLNRLLDVDKGFDVENVLTVDIGLAGSLYAEPSTREQFFDRLLTELNAIPGVETSGLVTQLPTRGETWLDPIYLEGTSRPEQRHSVNNRYASPGYFRAMNIAVRHGRVFDESDKEQGVAVLSEKAAKLLWPGEVNPVGRSFMGEDDKVKTLVGIVADVRASLPSDPPPTAYYPYWQRVPSGAALVVRTTGDPKATGGAVRAALRGADAQLSIPAIRSMEEVMDLSVAQRRFQLTLMIVFAGSALLVASLGIYGVVSYSVARRRNEIGIRMALGAKRSRLLGLVVRQGMLPVVVGLSIGLAAGLFVGRALRGLLFAVQPADPATITGVTLVLLVVAGLACLLPARRAASTDVIAALRFE